MIIEHMLFFSIGALSVCIAERILKIMIRKEKNTLIADRSNYFPSGSKVITISILWWKLILSRIFKLNMHRWTWITIACFLVFVWHIPQIFDFASTHVSVHVMQHFSFIMVGAAIFMTMRLLGESFNMFLIFSLIGMTGFGGLIFAISDSQIYETYSISSHHNAGVYMITTCLILLLVIMPVYLIRRTIYHINTSTVDDR